MKRILFATVSAIALAAGASAVSAADCNIGKEMNYTDADKNVRSGAVRRDLRSLRLAAMKLRDLGRHDECQEVVTWIKDIRADAKAEQMRAENRAKLTGDDREMKRVQRDTKMSYQDRAKARMASAKPMTDMAGRVSASDLIGVDLVGPGNDTAAEIEDVYVSTDGKRSYAIVGFGGFLGLGESLVAIPFSKIKVAMDEDGDATYYIPMTTEQLSKAPNFKRGDRTWMTNADWNAKNDKWFDGK